MLKKIQILSVFTLLTFSALSMEENLSIKETQKETSNLSDICDLLLELQIDFSKSVIGFDFDDTLSRRAIIDGDKILDHQLFNTEILRDNRDKFKNLTKKFNLCKEPLYTENSIQNKVLEDCYITKGVTIMRNKVLLATAERLYYEKNKTPLNIQNFPTPPYELLNNHKLIPLEKKQ